MVRLDEDEGGYDDIARCSLGLRRSRPTATLIRSNGKGGLERQEGGRKKTKKESKRVMALGNLRQQNSLIRQRGPVVRSTLYERAICDLKN